jgi:EAL domain-containing protein (putative c-di-GMP-specific phosphodiesterase class I)
MQDIEYTIRILKELYKLGVYASLDDFGTGYSSLSYLKRFPLKVLKIDQSFIQDIRINKNSEAITEAIIMMARSLDLEVIAEGVEKEDQLIFLRSLVCANVQGYFLSYPKTADELSEVFKTLPWNYPQ